MRNTLHPLQRLLIIFIGGMALFIFALVLLIVSFQINYSGRIYPGVSVGRIDLSGRTTAEAALTLATHYNYPHNGQLLFKDRDQLWSASPVEVGVMFDPVMNAHQAYSLGRTGSISDRLGDQFQTWYHGFSLPIRMTFDQRIARHYLETVATQVDIPTIEASLYVEGLDVVVQPGQIGRRVDIPTTIMAIEAVTQSMIDGEIALVVDEDPPVIMDVNEQAQVAREIISAPLIVNFPGGGEGDPGPWSFAREDLAGMLVIERVTTPEGAEYKVGLSNERLRRFLNEIAPDLQKNAENARFIFNDDTHQLDLIQPAAYGQFVDIETTIQKINSQVMAGEHTVSLDMEYSSPQVSDDATAEALGITELVNSHTTYYYGSSSSRRQNIATAAAQFHGLLIPPGETFSMASVLGDISLDTGYAEAWIIFGDRTIKGVGGGVCQVSTTLFRTVFFGGFPIVERYPHAYRVYYYEQTYGGGHDAKWAGLDATVYVPLVDFKFKNDTDYWLLMETYVGGSYLTWKFYSTSDGRSVDWSTTGLTDKQDPPEPRYEENAELDEGEIKQVDWPVEGAVVTVNRDVWRDGQIIDEDNFQTYYIPWRAVCEYGPGTDGMPPGDPNPDNPCRPD
ncbi:MAG: VanW family protein [Anaerolineales bacterium]|nr:VanW family protein [Chloroflexota bacterium]MBL6979666.1 VanW family protein [Anaerolineales bacterium]